MYVRVACALGTRRLSGGDRATGAAPFYLSLSLALSRTASLSTRRRPYRQRPRVLALPRVITLPSPSHPLAAPPSAAAMDISRAHARVTSSRAHRRLGDEPRARIDPTPPPDPDSDPDSDLLGIELDEWDLSPLDGERPTHSPPPTGWEDAQQPRLPAQVRRMAAASRKRSKPRPLSGYLATLFYVGKEIQREKDAERVRIAKAMPKAIEAALTAQRERMKRRKRVQAVCPNPVRGVRTFLANPVTRFWLGCNLCCTAFLFLVSRLSEEPHTPTRRASVRLSRPAVCVHRAPLPSWVCSTR